MSKLRSNVDDYNGLRMSFGYADMAPTSENVVDLTGLFGRRAAGPVATFKIAGAAPNI